MNENYHLDPTINLLAFCYSHYDSNCIDHYLIDNSFSSKKYFLDCLKKNMHSLVLILNAIYSNSLNFKKRKIYLNEWCQNLKQQLQCIFVQFSLGLFKSIFFYAITIIGLIFKNRILESFEISLSDKFSGLF